MLFCFTLLCLSNYKALNHPCQPCGLQLFLSDIVHSSLILTQNLWPLVFLTPLLLRYANIEDWKNKKLKKISLCGHVFFLPWSIWRWEQRTLGVYLYSPQSKAYSWLQSQSSQENTKLQSSLFYATSNLCNSENKGCENSEKSEIEYDYIYCKIEKLLPISRFKAKSILCKVKVALTWAVETPLYITSLLLPQQQLTVRCPGGWTGTRVWFCSKFQGLFHCWPFTV